MCTGNVKMDGKPLDTGKLMPPVPQCHLTFTENCSWLGDNRHCVKCLENDSFPKTSCCRCLISLYIELYSAKWRRFSSVGLTCIPNEFSLGFCFPLSANGAVPVYCQTGIRDRSPFHLSGEDQPLHQGQSAKGFYCGVTLRGIFLLFYCLRWLCREDACFLCPLPWRGLTVSSARVEWRKEYLKSF